MICYCGKDLGDATEKTHGLCPDCGQSIWMQAARRLQLNSGRIAAIYNQTKQKLCDHGQSVCISRCGVTSEHRVGEAADPGTWRAIAPRWRQEWFSRVMAHGQERSEPDLVELWLGVDR